MVSWALQCQPVHQPAPCQPCPSGLSAGYGELQRSEWPYWSVAAISPSNFLASNSTRLPKGGCGACLQLQCVDRPGYEVRQGGWRRATTAMAEALQHALMGITTPNTRACTQRLNRLA